MIHKITLNGSLSGFWYDDCIKFNEAIKFNIENDNLIIESKNSNSITINGDYICGKTIIGSKNSTITISGNNVIIDGKSIEELMKENQKEINKEKTENDIYMYKFNEDISLNKLLLNGSSSLKINKEIDLKNLKKIDLNGSSKLTIFSQCADDLYINMSGASKFCLNNNTLNDLDANTSGASSLILQNLIVNNLDITSSGASSVNGIDIKYNNINKTKSGVASISL